MAWIWELCLTLLKYQSNHFLCHLNKYICHNFYSCSSGLHGKTFIFVTTVNKDSVKVHFSKMHKSGYVRVHFSLRLWYSTKYHYSWTNLIFKNFKSREACDVYGQENIPPVILILNCFIHIMLNAWFLKGQYVDLIVCFISFFISFTATLFICIQSNRITCILKTTIFLTHETACNIPG